MANTLGRFFSASSSSAHSVLLKNLARFSTGCRNLCVCSDHSFESETVIVSPNNGESCNVENLGLKILSFVSIFSS